MSKDICYSVMVKNENLKESQVLFQDSSFLGEKKFPEKNLIKINAL